jgi:hypothetical protein
MASNLISMSGRGLPDRVDFGQSKDKGTPFIEVMIQTLRQDGSDGEVLSWKGWLTPGAIARTVEQLQLLGARIQGGDFEDLHGLGSKTANLAVSDDPQYGRRVEFINPPGRSSVSEETRLDRSKLAALKAALKPHALGAVLANGGGKAPSPAVPPPWQRGAGAPPSAPQQYGAAADVEPWSEPGAYDGLDQSSQAPQAQHGYAPPQAAVGGAGRRAPF